MESAHEVRRMVEWRIISVDGILVDLNFLENVLEMIGMRRELSPEDVEDARIMHKIPEDVEILSNDYEFIAYKKGYKYIHIFYRNPNFTNPESSRIFYHYYKIRRR